MGEYRAAHVAFDASKAKPLSSFLLRHGRVFSGAGHWTLAHRRWIAKQSFEHAAKWNRRSGSRRVG
jgi:hypothetical protein